MLPGERLKALRDELVALQNQNGTPAMVREDIDLVLADLGRMLPAEELHDERAADLPVGVVGASSDDKSPPPAPEPMGGAAAGETAAASVAAHPTRLAGTLHPDGRVEIRGEGQENVAYTLQTLLKALSGRRLTPLGEVGLDLVLAITRRDIELQRFWALLTSGKPLLEAAVDTRTPAGAAVANWYNEVVAWR